MASSPQIPTRPPPRAAGEPARTRSVAGSAEPFAWRAASGSDDLRRRLVALTFARLVVALIFLAATLLIGGPGSFDRPTGRAMVGIVLSIFVASVGYAVMLTRGRNLRRLAIVQIGLDLATWSALVYVTGGAASPMSFFFALSALTAALVLGAGAARITAVAAIAVYGALVVVSTLDGRPGAHDFINAPILSRPELALQLVGNVVAVLLVAGLGGGLASRLSRAGGALAQVEASRAAIASLYEDVLRSIPLALLTCDERGVIEAANPGATALLGAPAEALLGTPVARWLPFIPRDAFAAGQLPRSGDEAVEAAGARLPVSYLAAPLYDREKRARGGLVVVEDRSDAEALRDAVARTERLAALGRLTAAMAHEIRNPLGAISGCVELVRETAPLGVEDRALLSTVLREVARLNELVSDMLVFARPRQPERAPTDLVALAREVATLASAEDGRSDVPVRLVDPTPANPTARVDAAQMRQVLWNLVRNASSVSPEGSAVEIFVRARDDGALELAVGDRGRGIAPELRERIFEVFYSEGTRGTGLGLATVKQIVDAHDARIEVRERDGGGTEFAVVLARETA